MGLTLYQLSYKGRPPKCVMSQYNIGMAIYNYTYHDGEVFLLPIPNWSHFFTSRSLKCHLWFFLFLFLLAWASIMIRFQFGLCLNYTSLRCYCSWFIVPSKFHLLFVIIASLQICITRDCNGGGCARKVNAASSVPGRDKMMLREKKVCEVTCWLISEDMHVQ